MSWFTALFLDVLLLCFLVSIFHDVFFSSRLFVIYFLPSFLSFLPSFLSFFNFYFFRSFFLSLLYLSVVLSCCLYFFLSFFLSVFLSLLSFFLLFISFLSFVLYFSISFGFSFFLSLSLYFVLSFLLAGSFFLSLSLSRSLALSLSLSCSPSLARSLALSLSLYLSLSLSLFFRSLSLSLSRNPTSKQLGSNNCRRSPSIHLSSQASTVGVLEMSLASLLFIVLPRALESKLGMLSLKNSYLELRACIPKFKGKCNESSSLECSSKDLLELMGLLHATSQKHLIASCPVRTCIRKAFLSCRETRWYNHKPSWTGDGVERETR